MKIVADQGPLVVRYKFADKTYSQFGEDYTGEGTGPFEETRVDPGQELSLPDNTTVLEVASLSA